MIVNPPQNSALPLLGIYSKNAASYHRDMCSASFTIALFLIARNCKEQKYPSSDKYINKM